jgi:hypothetical protein
MIPPSPPYPPKKGVNYWVEDQSFTVQRKPLDKLNITVYLNKEQFMNWAVPRTNRGSENLAQQCEPNMEAGRNLNGYSQTWSDQLDICHWLKPKLLVTKKNTP